MAFFIVLEGIDGSGKSTTSQNLSTALHNIGISNIYLREPTQFPTGIRLREFLSGKIDLTPSEELQLFIDDRKESVSRNILPSLQEGKTVILDRYYFSTAAYQANSHRSSKDILDMNLKENFPIPDYLFYLDISVEKAMERIKSTRGNLDRFETIEKLEIIDKNYRSILPDSTIYIDATLKPEELIQKIISNIPI